MNLQKVVNSKFGIQAALWIGKTCPQKIGHRLASFLGGIYGAKKDNNQVKALRSNLWVATGKKLNGKELDKLVKRVFQSSAKCLFDFYHFYGNPEKILSHVDLGKDFPGIMERQSKGEQTIYVAPHVSNFDLLGQALTVRGVKFQIISYPNPNEAYQTQNQMREKAGLVITPASFEALSKAKKRLRNGGSILTGLDRPIEDNKYLPKFFGEPAPLPVAYVRLAIETKSPIIIVTPHAIGDGTYKLIISEPIEMVSHPDLHTEIIINTERILKIAEAFILENMDQWFMFYPIWPHLMTETPQ